MNMLDYNMPLASTILHSDCHVTSGHVNLPKVELAVLAVHGVPGEERVCNGCYRILDVGLYQSI